MTRSWLKFTSVAVLLVVGGPASALTMDELDEYLHRVDSELVREGENVWRIAVQERALMVIADEGADRMRIVTPIIEVEHLEPELFERMLTANYDAALDARYAIANQLVWGAFIHPLSDLTPSLLLSGIGQVVNVAVTFGTTYSSGVLVFGGGDSAEMQRDLIEKLQQLEHEQGT